MPYARASDGARIHYEAFGRRDAPAVLMIQGLGADKHGWDMQRFVLTRNYRVIAFDNRGAGRSDKPFGVYSIEQMADDAVAVLDEVEVPAAHVVGASMGGAISQLMAVRHPTRVLSLTLACTACRNQPWRRELLKRWMATAQERGMGAMTSEAARWVMAPARSDASCPPSAGSGHWRWGARPIRSSPRSGQFWRLPTNSPTNCTASMSPLWWSSVTKTSSPLAATARRSPIASRAPNWS